MKSSCFHLIAAISIGMNGTFFLFDTQYPTKIEMQKATTERSSEKAVMASQELLLECERDAWDADTTSSGIQLQLPE